MASRRNFIVSASAMMLAACAGPTPVTRRSAPRFAWGQPVEFEGMLFTFQKAKTVNSFVNWVNHTITANDVFVIVEMTVVNKTGAPLPVHLQPAYKLIDKAGAEYVPNVQQTIVINMGRPGRLPHGQPMNPGTSMHQEVVFDAQRKKYDLQVIVPNRARVGFAGSVTSSGPYFLYDLSTELPD